MILAPDGFRTLWSVGHAQTQSARHATGRVLGAATTRCCSEGVGECFGAPGLRYFEGWNAMLRRFTARGGQLDGIRRNESLSKKCSILKQTFQAQVTCLSSGDPKAKDLPAFVLCDDRLKIKRSALPPFFATHDASSLFHSTGSFGSG